MTDCVKVAVLQQRDETASELDAAMRNRNAYLQRTDGFCRPGRSEQ